jgi:DNA-binding protein HU-beta
MAKFCRFFWIRDISEKREFEDSNVNKADIVKEVADATGFKQKDCRLVLNALLTSIERSVAKGEVVTFTGFGTFKSKLRNPRTCKNPVNGEPVEVSERLVPIFSPASAFRDFVEASDSDDESGAA